MFQPFELFSHTYIKKLIQFKKVYIVTQGYKAGTDIFNAGKIPLLLTDYDDIGLANIHKAAVKTDHYAAVIHLHNMVHRQKLESMLAADAGYILYWSVIKDLDLIKKNIDTKYKDNIRRYILKNTTWRIGGDETINPQLSVIFGELFVFLKHGAQQLRVKFEEIEKA